MGATTRVGDGVVAATPANSTSRDALSSGSLVLINLSTPLKAADMIWRLLPVLLLLTPGCFKVGPKTNEDVYVLLMKNCNELTDLLLKIDDETGANEKAPRAKKLTDQMRALKAEKDANDRFGPTPQNEAARKKYEVQWATTLRRLVNQYQRLLHRTPGAKDLLDDLKSLLESFGLNPTAPAFRQAAS
jgi:hypothetical protein